MVLQDLPPEVIETILTYLNPKDILKVGWCCRNLQTIARNEQVWIQCALRKYSVDLRNNLLDASDDKSSHDQYICRSARIFTVKILMPLGIDFKEIWCLENRGQANRVLGKLLYHDWSVYLVLLHPPSPPNTHHLFKPEILCRLHLREDLLVSENKENSIQFKEFFEPYSFNAKGPLRCGNPLIILKNESKPTVIKYRAYTGVLIFKSLKTNNTVVPPFCPIRPGLFKGMYKGILGNDIKIINVTYEKDLKTLTGRKLTFDPKVPLDEISFEAYLDKMLILSPEDKLSFERIKDNMHSQENIHQIPLEKDQISSRFVYPPECQIAGLIDRDVFRKELWRFQARCKNASNEYVEFFKDTRFMDGNLIIFSEDIFGVMFIESQVLSIFERVKESLCDTQFSNVLQKLPEDGFDLIGNYLFYPIM